jgi:hypothetical protein
MDEFQILVVVGNAMALRLAGRDNELSDREQYDTDETLAQRWHAALRALRLKKSLPKLFSQEIESSISRG